MAKKETKKISKEIKQGTLMIGSIIVLFFIVLPKNYVVDIILFVSVILVTTMGFIGTKIAEILENN